MNLVDFTDRWVVPLLAFLANWSVRWGILLAIFLTWLALKPPRDAASRYFVCAILLAAGMLVPFVPRWVEVPFSGLPTPIPATARAAAPDEPPALSAAAFNMSLTVSNDTSTSGGVSTRPDIDRKSPRRAALGAWRWIALAVAGAWGTAVAFFTSRIVAGRLVLAHLRRDAVDAGRAFDSLLSDCRRAISLARPVRLASHPSVGSPVTIGGRAPLVLVPPDWPSWTDSNRRACLLHELAHLARRDDWVKLAQEVVRAVFFFHPMVLWLLTRLDRERELLCDEAAVALGADPLAYARLLLDLARRPGRLVPFGIDCRSAPLSFLDRRTVAARIERLLEPNMSRTISSPHAGRRLALATLTAGAAVIVGGLGVATARPSPAGDDRAVATKPNAEPTASKLRAIEGVVLDPDGKPAAGAVVVAGILDTASNHAVYTTSSEGRFTFPVREGTVMAYIVAHKEGHAPATYMRWFGVGTPGAKAELKLGKLAPFTATLLDSDGRPVGGARVRLEMLAHTSRRARDVSGNTSVSTGWWYVRREVVDGSPLQRVFETTTDPDGSFTLNAAGAESWLKLAVTTAEGRAMRVKARDVDNDPESTMLTQSGFVDAPAAKPARLLAIPAARVIGRVTTKLDSIRLADLTVSYEPSRMPGDETASANFGGRNLPIADDGRFAIDGLDEGTINVFVRGTGEGQDWTFRAASNVLLKSGETSEVVLEVIRGVDVEGTVVARDLGTPVVDAGVGVYGPYRPRSGAFTQQAKTDAKGRYHYRLPAGETYFYVMAPPAGFIRSTGPSADRTVVIPEGVDHYEVPRLELAAAVTLRGRVLDTAGAPVARATIVGTCVGNVCQPFPGKETVTDARGEFRLPEGGFNTVVKGSAARLLIRLSDGAEHEAAAVPADDGMVTLRVPARADKRPAVVGPQDVLADELAGVVVDTEGKPIDGVEVDAWTWYPGNETRTDARGHFRLKKLDKNRKVEVVFRKPGFTPHLFVSQPTGAPDWVVVLGNKTYFEGTVTSPAGKPVADALIRANQGPKQADGVMITEIWTETRTDKEGRYRMYAQADLYDIQVRVPNVGVARLKETVLGSDEARHLDIALTPGAKFRARMVDSVTAKPVAGVRLWHWQHKGIEGRSGEDGMVTIADMLPGPFHFSVDAPGYARWWSEQAATEWARRQVLPGRTGGPGWQRNFDMLDFDVRPDAELVTITLEPAVKITGEVRDPLGKPVAGATVAPALTGTGNSLTGDTRFSVKTDANGRFEMALPASGEREYNLVAHDGGFQQWRTWANGVHRPFKTRPGESLSVVILLTRPARVRGRVVDHGGAPVAGREVRSSAADRLENRYYDPTARTAADGTFELKFVRPGEQYIQVAPFWLDAKDAPSGTSMKINLEPGETKTELTLQADTRPR